MRTKRFTCVYTYIICVIEMYNIRLVSLSFLLRNFIIIITYTVCYYGRELFKNRYVFYFFFIFCIFHDDRVAAVRTRRDNILPV